MAWQDKPIEAIGGGILSYFDELKDMLGKNKKKKGIKVGEGVMDAATGVKSAFEQKMNWLADNPNASNYELQLLGITPEVQSAFQEKMQWLGQNPNATEQELGILGIGTRALNTPSERDWLKNVMSGASFGMNNEAASVIQDKVKYVSEVLKKMGVQEGSLQFRQMMHKMLSNSGIGDRGLNTAAEQDWLRNVTSGGGAGAGVTDKMKFVADTLKSMGVQEGSPQYRDMMLQMLSGVGMSNEAAKVIQDKVKGYGNYITELDIGSRGLATAAEKDFIADSFVGKGQDKLLNNWQDKATAQASDTQQQMFENKLNQLDQGQLDQVMKVMSPMTTEQKERFVSDVINGQVSLTGYGIQDEAQPGELTPNFAGQGIQYNTGTTLPNLGFAGY